MLLLGPAILAGAYGCASAPQGAGPAASGQVLAMAINLRSVPPPALADFYGAVDLAAGAGVKGVVLAWTWSNLEPAWHSFVAGAK